jgi:hypothetical protein
VKHLSDAPLYGRLLALPTKIRLGLKGLLGTNAPANARGSAVIRALDGSINPV